MSLINWALDTVPEDVILPAGEHELQVSSVSLETAKESGKPYLNVAFQAEGNFATIYKIMMFPDSADNDDRPSVLRRRAFKEFALACNISLSDLQNVIGALLQGNKEPISNLLIGRIALCRTGVEENPDYGRKATIRRFIQQTPSSNLPF